jgi:hypothetical protein
MFWSMVGERGILLAARWWLDPPPPATQQVISKHMSKNDCGQDQG